MNIEGDALQRRTRRAPVRRTRWWHADMERPEDRSVLSSATAHAIEDVSPTVFLNQAGKVSRGHAAIYRFVVHAASVITVDVSKRPRAEKERERTTMGLGVSKWEPGVMTAVRRRRSAERLRHPDRGFGST
jgi:hypothetical protein